MNDRQIPRARLAVRRASDRLAENARAFTIASARAREVGVAVRVADLRQAVVTAWRAGVSLRDIAHAARLDMATIEEWTARERPAPPDP